MLDVDEPELAPLSLEALAQRVADEARDRLDTLREQAASAFDFRGIAPNFGHEAVALLLREGLAHVISANWDCGIERAGIRAGVAIQGVANAAESIQLAHTLPLYKVHGCATRPSTLALTQTEVDGPQAWAVGRTQGALADGIVVFVGLGTVGLYVEEPIPDLVKAWASQAASIAVVDPNLPKAWESALGDEAAAAHIPRTGDAFFDELLRAVVRDAFDASEMAARQLVAHEAWATRMVRGFEALRTALDTATAEGVLRWWRDGVIETESGKPFITELRGQKCLMTIALLTDADGGQAEATGGKGRQTIATASQYLEIACRPGQHVSRVEIVVRDRIERRRAEGVYSADKPVTVVVVEEMGEFPSPEAPANIAAGDDDATDIVSGVEAAAINFVSADDGVRGRLAR